MADPGVQALLWVWATLVVMALVVREDRRFAGLLMILAIGVLAAGAVMMASNEAAVAPWDACLKLGGSQMVHIDGGWQCVPPGQES